MKYEEASHLAAEFVRVIEPHCERIESAGNIRRKRPICHDIDILMIPRNMNRLGLAVNTAARVLSGGKAIWTLEFRGAQVDIYFATPATWATLLLIRNGSKEHNVFLARRARSLGMELKASGAGLFRNGVRIAGDTEESIFEALGLPYKEPEEREVV